jgi:hypothetical protein
MWTWYISAAQEDDIGKSISLLQEVCNRSRRNTKEDMDNIWTKLLHKPQTVETGSDHKREHLMDTAYIGALP